MNSRIILAKGINVDRDYNNVLNYSESDMLALLRSEDHLVKEYIKYSFIRDKGYIDTSFSYSEVLNANYIAFQNPDYDNKWFFAWIDDVQYIGNNNTRITYTIDSWSTWFDKITVKKCFVKRHHVNDDTIGANIVNENLNVGEVICENSQNFNIDSQLYIAIETTWIVTEIEKYSDPLHPTGDYRASGYSTVNPARVILGNIVGYDLILMPYNATGLACLKTYLIASNLAGHIKDISNIYILPIKTDSTHTLSDYTFVSRDTTVSPETSVTYYYYRYSENFDNYNETIQLNITLNTFSDYTPKNNKCFVYPTNYLLLSNNVGSKNILKIENFSNINDINFEYELTYTIGASGRLIPKNYKGISRNLDESLALAKYPTCSWSSDAYTNWLTQNAINIPVKILTEFLPGVSGLNPNAGITSTIGNFIGSFYEASLLPQIEGGQPTGDVNFTSGDNDFNIYHMRSKKQYLKIIDDYFTRFGYAIKSLETPNITGRTYWNYVEIGDEEEIGYGDVPHKFMDQINKACRKGVTIWHNHINIGNWDLDNSIVTP